MIDRNILNTKPTTSNYDKFLEEKNSYTEESQENLYGSSDMYLPSKSSRIADLENKRKEKIANLNKNSQYDNLNDTHTVLPDGTVDFNSNKIWNDLSGAEISSLFEEIEKNHNLERREDGIFNKVTGERYQGPLRRLYGYGTKTSEKGFKLGLSRGDQESSDIRYQKWLSGNSGVDINKKHFDMLVPDYIAIAFEGLVHGRKGAQAGRSVPDILDSETYDKYGSGASEYYRSREALLGNPKSKDFGEAFSPEEARKTLYKYASQGYVNPYYKSNKFSDEEYNAAKAENLAERFKEYIKQDEFKNADVFDRLGNTVKGFASTFISELLINPIDAVGDLTGWFDLGTEEEKTAYMEDFSGYNSKFVEESMEEIGKHWEIITDKNATDLEKLKAVGNGILEAFMTPEMLGTSLGALLSWLTPGVVLKGVGLGAKFANQSAKINRLRETGQLTKQQARTLKMRRLQSVDGVKDLLINQSGYLTAALGNVNNQYEQFVENNNGVELEGAEKGKWFAGRLGIQVVNQNIDKIIDVNIIKSPAFLATIVPAVKGMTNKEFAKVAKTMGIGVAKTVTNAGMEAAQEYSQTMMEVFNSRFGSEKFSDVDTFVSFIMDKRNVDEAGIAAIAGAGGSGQFEVMGSAGRALNISTKMTLNGIAKGYNDHKNNSRSSETISEQELFEMINQFKTKATSEETVSNSAASFYASYASNDKESVDKAKAKSAETKSSLLDGTNTIFQSDKEFGVKLDELKEQVEIARIEDPSLNESELIIAATKAFNATQEQVPEIEKAVNSGIKEGMRFAQIKTMAEVSDDVSIGARGFVAYYAAAKIAKAEGNEKEYGANLSKLERFFESQTVKLSRLKEGVEEVTRQIVTEAELLVQSGDAKNVAEALDELRIRYKEKSARKKPKTFEVKHSETSKHSSQIDYYNVLNNMVNGKEEGIYKIINAVESETTSMNAVYKEIVKDVTGLDDTADSVVDQNIAPTEEGVVPINTAPTQDQIDEFNASNANNDFVDNAVIDQQSDDRSIDQAEFETQQQQTGNETALPQFTKTFPTHVSTFFESVKEKDGITTTSFTFNRDDKLKGNRSKTGVPLDYLSQKGYEIADPEMYVPEGAEVTKVFEIREGDNGTGAYVIQADVEFTVDGEKFIGGVALKKKAPIQETNELTGDAQNNSGTVDTKFSPSSNDRALNPINIEKADKIAGFKTAINSINATISRTGQTTEKQRIAIQNYESEIAKLNTELEKEDTSFAEVREATKSAREKEAVAKDLDGIFKGNSASIKVTGFYDAQGNSVKVTRNSESNNISLNGAKYATYKKAKINYLVNIETNEIIKQQRSGFDGIAEFLPNNQDPAKVSETPSSNLTQTQEAAPEMSNNTVSQEDVDQYSFNDSVDENTNIQDAVEDAATQDNTPNPVDERAVDPEFDLSTEQTSENSLQDKLAEGKKKALEDLTKLLKSKKGTLNSGVDPEILIAIAKVGAYAIAQGAVKFSDWVRDILSSTKKLGIEDGDVRPHLKEVYGAISANPEKYNISEDVADNMDDFKTVRKTDVDNLEIETSEPKAPTLDDIDNFNFPSDTNLSPLPMEDPNEFALNDENIYIPQDDYSMDDINLNIQDSMMEEDTYFDESGNIKKTVKPVVEDTKSKELADVKAAIKKKSKEIIKRRAQLRTDKVTKENQALDETLLELKEERDALNEKLDSFENILTKEMVKRKERFGRFFTSKLTLYKTYVNRVKREVKIKLSDLFSTFKPTGYMLSKIDSNVSQTINAFAKNLESNLGKFKESDLNTFISYLEGNITRVFLYDNEGNFNSNVVAAMQGAAYEYLVQEASSIYEINPKDEDVAKQFGIDENVEPALMDLMAEGGVTLKLAGAAVGAKVYKNLGLQIENVKEREAVIMQLGMTALQGVDEKYLKNYRMDVSQIDSLKARKIDMIIAGPELMSGLKDIREVNESFEKAFNVEIDKERNYTELAPTKDRKVLLHNAEYQEAPKDHTETVNKLEKTPFRFNSGSGVLNEMFGDSNQKLDVDKIILQLLGNKPKKTDSKDAQDTYVAQAEAVRRSVMFYSNAKEDVKEGNIFFKWFIAKQHRIHLDSNGLNPQNDKNFSRWLVTTVNSITNITKKGLNDTLNGLETSPDMMKDVMFAYGIVQAFDGVKGLVGIDKNIEIEILAAAKDILQNKSEEELFEMAKSAQHVGHAALAIANIRKYREKGAEFTSDMVLEVDGLTNGFAFRSLQFPKDSSDFWPSKIGFVTQTSALKDVESMNEAKSKKQDDVYVSVGSVFATLMSNNLKEINEKNGNDAKWIKLFKDREKLFDSSSSQFKKFIRNLMKSPVMVFNYAAGIKKITAGLVDDQIRGRGYLSGQGLIDTLTEQNENNEYVLTQKELIDTFGEEKGSVYHRARIVLSKVSIHSKENSDVITLKRDLYGSIRNLYGEPLDDTLKDLFSNQTAINRVVTNVSSLVFNYFKEQYTVFITDNKNATEEDKLEFLKDKVSIIPGIAGASSDTQQNKITFLKSVLEETNNEASISLDGKKDLTSNTVSRGFADPGVAAAVLTILSLDSSALSKTINSAYDKATGALIIHDAMVLGIGESKTINAYNESFYDVNRNYSIMEEFVKMLEGFEKEVGSETANRLYLTTIVDGEETTISYAKIKKNLIARNDRVQTARANLFRKDVKIGQMVGPRGTMVEFKAEEQKTEMNSPINIYDGWDHDAEVRFEKLRSSLKESLQKPDKDVKSNYVEKPLTIPDSFDEELNDKLAKKLKELYPEISVEYTTNLIEKEDGAEYQKETLVDEVKFNKVMDKLIKLYPSISQQDVDKVLKKYGKDEINNALTATVNLDSNTERTSLPFEYSLLYVDLLQTTTFMKNSIKMLANEKEISTEQAKVLLATNMAKYVLDGVNGEPITRETSLAKKVWDNIIKVFNTLFGGKDMLKDINERRTEIVAKRLMDGINKEGITLEPNKGTKLIDPSFDFENQPFAAGVVYDVVAASSGDAIFTGSEALATQGKVYRSQEKNGTELHYLDFAVSSVDVIKKIIKTLEKNYSIYEAYNFHVPKKSGLTDFTEKLVTAIPGLMVLKPLVMATVKLMPSNNIVTQILVPKDNKINNIKRLNGKGRIISYDIVDSKNNVVGTYRASVKKGIGFKTIITEEATTGVKAIVVDLLENGEKRDPVNWKAPNGDNIKVERADNIFKAKNKTGSHIARDKDVINANSFYNSSFKQESNEEFQKEKGTGAIKGKANLAEKTIVINSLIQTQDTLPHEYAHHYIGMFRDAPIVKKAIEKWGSEEALVQAIGEQVVEQKGEAYGWWLKFTDWLMRMIKDVNEDDKELLKNMLTDSFLTRQDLTKEVPVETKKGRQEAYTVSGTMKTNEGQTQSINDAINWYNNEKGGTTFLLQGRGGTGKTTVVNVLLKELGIRNSQVNFAAPTNKAKKVIEQANKDNDYRKSGYYTVAQMLGMKVKTVDGVDIFEIDSWAKLPDMPKVLVVDESSMLKSDHYSKLIKRAEEVGGKIVFMGDNAQMPPINDPKGKIKSVVFDDNKNTGTRLTQLMRQAEGSPIIAVTSKLIETVNKIEEILEKGGREQNAQEELRNLTFDNNDYGKFNEESNEGVILTNGDFSNILPSFLKDFKKDPTSTKVLMFNKSSNTEVVNNLNRIRDGIYGEKASEQFIAGEPVVLQGAVDYDITSEDRTLLDNGEEFTVVSSNIVSKKIVYKVGKDLKTTQDEIFVYELIVKDRVNGMEYQLDRPVEGFKGQEALVKKEKKWLIDNDNDKRENHAYMIRKSLATSLEYGYIINSHKAQGSSYNNVYVDVGNIMGGGNPSANGIIKSLYTASSRPIKKLVLMDNRKNGILLNTKKIDNTKIITSEYDNINDAEANDINKQQDKCGK